MRIKDWIDRNGIGVGRRLKKMMMKCFYSGEELGRKEMNASSESLATRDFSASGYSSRPGEPDPKVDNGNIEEAESSLRESGFLNYEEARALLGRLEYQKGNTEAALQVFEGIDIPAIIPRIKTTLSTRSDPPKRHSQTTPQMSLHAVTLLFEAIFLKSKSLQSLQRFKEAAESCQTILEIIESALPNGFLQFSSYSKLQETVSRSVELLPELWKSVPDPHSTISSYRRALLYQWNLDHTTRINIEKQFAVFLLYSGCDAAPPNLKSQMESSYVPKNNVEEAVLLLLILLDKIVVGVIEWDASIVYHLSFALSCDLTSLAQQIEALPAGVMGREEHLTTLALCYVEGDKIVSLNLLRSLFNRNKETQETETRQDYGFQMLLASKICGESLKSDYIEEGIGYLKKLVTKFEGNCEEMVNVANLLLGISLSAKSRTTSLDSERVTTQIEAMNAFQSAHRMIKHEDANILYNLSIEYAESRKLDVALYYAKELVRIEAGANVKGWILLARILSAQKQYSDAENIIDAGLDETGKWDNGELLRTKAKLQIAQGDLKNGIETYTRLLAVLQVQNKSSGVYKKKLKKSDKERRLEMETWHDLADVYTSLSQWRDAEVCLLKSKAIDPHSAARWHATGLLHEAKGEKEEALSSFEKALDVDPNHVPTLISTAIALLQLNQHSVPVAKSFLTDALRLDRTNPRAWFNLGLVHKAEHGSSSVEAAECFEAAIMLQESQPVEPFR